MADDLLLKLSTDLGQSLKSRGWKLALAESCTGGMAAQYITAIPGSSAWFDRGFVTYSNAAKVEMLGVAQTTLDRYGAVSEETAKEMAQGAISHSHANIVAAITGIAGPDGGTVEKPVGFVCFAWAMANAVQTETRLFTGDRLTIRQQAVACALQGALKYVRDIAT